MLQGSEAEQVLAEAKRLADGLGQPMTALHVETPEGAPPAKILEVLQASAEMGAETVSIPASSVLDGVVSQAAQASHVVLGSRPRQSRIARPSLTEKLRAALPDKVLVSVAYSKQSEPLTQVHARSAERNAGIVYLIAFAAIAATVSLVLVLRPLIGPQGLALLFLVPTLAVAARWGFRPAMFASVLAAASFNFFILKPAFAFRPGTPQDVLMLGTLVALSAYTSFITGSLRKRAILSDRSAQENAALAALARDLTKAADWDSTAETLCRGTAPLLGLEVAVMREIDGELVMAGASPPDPVFGPVDQAALAWAWSNGEEAGSGTQVLPAANWQFHPLKTSLGRLAVLAVARHDGRNPLVAEKQLLFSTILAQASLAHERLRLEDEMRCSPG
ncbi:DUF4118 domain-containing protein [Sphingomonas parva]|uniref:DUF4118 domain-containing protein n=1 Tax=Sphingomonas parva TaxID=2555898 RepID=UPI00142FA057|nr:DUF4118 domain-containing protein [Sphingomonas parva]